jgi:CP family cyanate transporter-like MFS transporter
MLWLFGLCLRSTVLAIPPIIPMIHDSLALTQAQVGALASLPVLLFSFAAVPGAILIARFGAFRVLVAGTLLTGLGSALRGAAPDAALLFATTFVMGVGIAIMQPALPSVVREWVPQRIALGTAAYSNGLLMGEAFAASLTIPAVLPAVGNDWRLALVAWSLPVFLIAAAGAWHQRGMPPSPCTRGQRCGGPTGDRR